MSSVENGQNVEIENVADEPRLVAAPSVQVWTCVECGREWRDAGERWRAYLTTDDPPLLGLFCAACFEREFAT